MGDSYLNVKQKQNCTDRHTIFFFFLTCTHLETRNQFNWEITEFRSSQSTLKQIKAR